MLLRTVRKGTSCGGWACSAVVVADMISLEEKDKMLSD
jgi:hypothetical protein